MRGPSAAFCERLALFIIPDADIMQWYVISGSDARQSSRHSSGVVAAASRQKTDSPAQPSPSRRLSRTGKPVGWSVLPQDDHNDEAGSRQDADAVEPAASALHDEVRVKTLPACASRPGCTRSWFCSMLLQQRGTTL